MAKNLALLWLPTFQPGDPWLVWYRVSGSVSGELADPLGDPVEIAGSAQILANDPGIELMLGNQHSFGQGFRRVVRQNRDLDLAKCLSGIELGRDQVNGRASDVLARLETGLVGLQALVLRQKRRVDVDDPAFPPGEEIVGNDAHEACQRDQIDVRRFERGLQTCKELRLVPLRQLAGQSERLRLPPKRDRARRACRRSTSATS